jgi:hypothetical protein
MAALFSLDDRQLNFWLNMNEITKDSTMEWT